MKRIVQLTTVIIILLFALSGCNIKQKISEKITEGILEKVVGDEADIDINGDGITFETDEGKVSFGADDGITIEGEDGSVMYSGENSEWPSSQAAEYLPKLEKGTISYVMNSETSCIVMAGEIDMEDYKEYKNALIKAGFDANPFNNSAEDMEMYSASRDDGVVVTVSYIPSDQIFQVSLDASEKK